MSVRYRFGGIQKAINSANVFLWFRNLCLLLFFAEGLRLLSLHSQEPRLAITMVAGFTFMLQLLHITQGSKWYFKGFVALVGLFSNFLHFSLLFVSFPSVTNPLFRIILIIPAFVVYFAGAYLGSIFAVVSIIEVLVLFICCDDKTQIAAWITMIETLVIFSTFYTLVLNYEIQTKSAVEELKIARDEAERHRDDAIHNAEIMKHFISTISHEIRNPLSGILGIVQTTLESCTLNEEARVNLQLIQQSGALLHSIVNNILDLGRLESSDLPLETIVFDLRKCIESSIDLLKSKSKVPISKKISEEVPILVRGDPHRFQQILLNLLSNAVKFTDEGRIIVKAHYFADRKPCLQVSVQDTGIGIEEKSSLFVPWKQSNSSTARQYGGSGLGLCITKMLVELMGGKIWCTSSPGIGTTFYFSVDLVAASLLELQKDKESSFTPFSTQTTLEEMNLSVLVAEDNIANQMFLLRCLEKLGIPKGSIDIVCDGEEAVAAVQMKRYDLIFMDLHMPKLDGYDATSRIRADPRNYRTFVVAVTGVDSLNRSMFQGMGIDAVVSKPIHLHELNDAVRTFLKSTTT